MKTITFVSHYNKLEMNIRISDEKAEQLFNNKNYSPIELYARDCSRVVNGQEPEYFSKGQLNKLNNYHPGIDYWDEILSKKVDMDH